MELIHGEANGYAAGKSVSLSNDGDTVAIGEPCWKNVDGDMTGHTRIFNWDGTDWNQVGDDIEGKAAGDQAGVSVSLSHDGTTVLLNKVFSWVLKWDGTS